MTFGTCTRQQRNCPVNASVAIAMVAFSFPSIAHASAGPSSPEEAILVALQIKTTPEGLRAYLIEMSNSIPRSKEVDRLIAELAAGRANLGVASGRQAIEEAAESLEMRGIIVVERGRFRVRDRSVLRYYARTIEHLLVTTGRTH